MGSPELQQCQRDPNHSSVTLKCRNPGKLESNLKRRVGEEKFLERQSVKRDSLRRAGFELSAPTRVCAGKADGGVFSV